MLTLFTTCRPFDNGEFAAIQRNTMKTWTLLEPRPEIIVMGNEAGVADFCKEMGFRQADIEYSKHGTPMLDSMMSKAEEIASNNILLLVSSDVILFQSTMKALKALKEVENFCAVARKKQQQFFQELDFERDWKGQVREALRWNLITSGDFFMYPKGFWGKIPPFIIVRTACDSWLFHEASRRDALIDLTPAVEIIDYKHSYSHRPETGKKRSNITTNCVATRSNRQFLMPTMS